MKRSIESSFVINKVVLVLLLTRIQEATSLAVPQTATFRNHPVALGTVCLQHTTCRSESSPCLTYDRIKCSYRRRNQGTARLHAGLLAPLTKAVGSVCPALRNGVLLGAAALKDHVTWQEWSILPKPEDGSVIAPRPSSWKKDESRRMADALV